MTDANSSALDLIDAPLVVASFPHRAMSIANSSSLDLLRASFGGASFPHPDMSANTPADGTTGASLSAATCSIPHCLKSLQNFQIIPDVKKTSHCFGLRRKSFVRYSDANSVGGFSRESEIRTRKEVGLRNSSVTMTH